MVYSLTVSRLHAFLFYVDLACPDYLGLRFLYIIDLLFVAHLRNFYFCVDLVFPGYSGLRPFLMIDMLTVAHLMRNSNMINNFKTIILFILTDKTKSRDKFFNNSQDRDNDYINFVLSCSRGAL